MPFLFDPEINMGTFKPRPSCFFKGFDDEWGPCDGRLDRCHIVPKQRLKREVPEVDVWHEDWWVWGCRRHHGQFDNRRCFIQRSDVPMKTEKAAARHGIEWSLDRDYGMRTDG